MNIKSITLALGKAVNESTAVMDKPADLMNVAIAELIKHRMDFYRLFLSHDFVNFIMT